MRKSIKLVANVTRMDIKKGTKTPPSCPVALAINRACKGNKDTKGLKAFVTTLFGVSLADEDGQVVAKARTSSAACMFIGAFDLGSEVHPTKFELEFHVLKK